MNSEFQLVSSRRSDTNYNDDWRDKFGGILPSHRVGVRMKTYGSFTLDQVRSRNFYCCQVENIEAVDFGESEIEKDVIVIEEVISELQYRYLTQERD